MAGADRGDPPALATLGEDQRKVFLLRELGGFSYAEIAAQLDTSVPAVQMLLFRARQKLRAELAGPVPGRVAGLIPMPHWLVGLADRVPAGFAGPRIAGFVAASVIAAGVGVTSEVSVAEPKVQPSGHAPLVASTPVRARVAASVVKASHARVRGAIATKHGMRLATVTRPAIAPARPKTQVVESGVETELESEGAEPAATVAPPATVGIDDGAPAPALIPALPPVSQAPIVPVVEARLPPLPELPVDDVVPALPSLPIVQPPLLPALPGGAEVTIPAVTSLLAGP